MSNAAAQPKNRTPMWWIVAQREIAVKLRDRNFIISLLATLVILAGTFGLQAWLMNRTSTVNVVTPQAQASEVKKLIDSAQKAADANDAKTKYIVKTAADEAAAKAEVTGDEADAAIFHDKAGWRLVGDKSVPSELEKYVTQVAQSDGIAANAAAQKVDLNKLTAGTSVQTQTLTKDSGDRGVAMVVALIFSFLFYMATMLFGIPIAQSVVEEKQSRIVEILASAMPLRQLMAGKIIGNSLIAIGQLALIVSVALIGMSQTQWKSSVGTVAAASGWFVVFFIAGFLVIACLMAVAGALASRSEDVQTTAQPAMMLIMVTFIVGWVANGMALKVASFVPVVSSVAMPNRLAAGEATWWEALIALVIALAAAALVTRFAARLYTRSVMQTGGRMTMRQAMKASN